MRIAIAGLFEEVNTFATESMGYATITGNMTTGFQLWSALFLFVIISTPFNFFFHPFILPPSLFQLYASFLLFFF